jgi:hypothetical protein
MMMYHRSSSSIHVDFPHYASSFNTVATTLIMTSPQPQDPLAPNKYCRAWDRIFHPHQSCPGPSSRLHESSIKTTSAVAQAPTPGASLDDNGPVFGLIATIIGLGVVFLFFSSMCLRHKRNKRLRAQLHRERRPQAQPPKPSLISRLSTWWTNSRSQERSRPRDVEMGRFKRGLSSVRSIAKLTPEIHISNSNHIIQTPSTNRTRTRTRMAPRAESSPRRQRAPRYAPPAYENTPRGNPIADEFMSNEARGAEPSVGTPPPTYQQRTGDDYFWEDDGTPAPGYSHPWPQT